MKSDIKKGLDDVFAKHEASRKAAAERQQAIQTKEEAFLKEFLEKRDSIIRPAMEAVGQYLKEKGYSSEITTEEDGYSKDLRSILIAGPGILASGSPGWRPFATNPVGA
jgi:hypothetical protein